MQAKSDAFRGIANTGGGSVVVVGFNMVGSNVEDVFIMFGGVGMGWEGAR